MGLALAAPAPAQFSVSPVVIPVEAADGVRTLAFHVHNEASEPLSARLSIADFDQDDAGAHRILAAGAHERSCADRISVTPDVLTIPGGGTQPVRVSVRPDPDGRACWSLVLVESRATAASGVAVNLRIAVKILGLPTDGTTEARIVDASFDQETAPTVRFRVANEAAAPLEARGSVEIRTFSGEILGKVPVETFSLLPGRSRSVSLELPFPLEPGRYLAIPILEYGSDGMAGAQIAFRVRDG